MSASKSSGWSLMSTAALLFASLDWIIPDFTHEREASSRLTFDQGRSTLPWQTRPQHVIAVPWKRQISDKIRAILAGPGLLEIDPRKQSTLLSSQMPSERQLSSRRTRNDKAFVIDDPTFGQLLPQCWFARRGSRDLGLLGIGCLGY